MRTTLLNDKNWVPRGLPDASKTGLHLCPGAFLSPEGGKAVLDAALIRFPDRARWHAYDHHLRSCIQRGLNLDPWPRRSPLNPIHSEARVYDGYSVKNVAFESVPGYFVAGNLYRPLRAEPPFPVVLLTHGHTAKIENADDFEGHGRFAAEVQACGASLARLGIIALSIDMFGYGDSMAQVGAGAHGQPFSLTIQTWNAMRSLDFLLQLDGADPSRVGVIGASGGATQALILAALDARVTLSVPVVMVSAHFFGGCSCESGLPIHRSAQHFASNAMIAALAAPRPQLLISDGKDWTSNTPDVEFPFLQRIYGFYGATQDVQNGHLPDEGHDFGPSKRAAMLDFVSAHFGLRHGASSQNEPDVVIEKSALMRVWSDAETLPTHACASDEAVEGALRQLQ